MSKNVSPENIDVKQLSGKYAQHIMGIFQLKIEDGYSTNEDIPFDKQDITRAEEEFGLDRIKNPPDLKYNLRSRGKLPPELRDLGYATIIQNEAAKRKDAAYLLTKTSDTIKLAAPDEKHQFISSSIPSLVEVYSSTDEQGILTRVRYAGVLNDFTGFDCHHLQSHLRTSGDSGQVEIDDLYIASDAKEDHHAIICEGKGIGETFSRNQIYRNTQAVRSKSEYPDSVLAIGIKLIDEEQFAVVEFEVPTNTDTTVEVSRLWEYTIVKRDQNTLEGY